MVEVKARSYRVVYERDEDGWWVASVPSVQGCHTQGRSINEARERIREALGLFIKDADRVHLEDDVHLPADARGLITRQQRARERAERENEKARGAVSLAVTALTKDLGLSTRDTGELLQLSQQRIQQLTAGLERKRDRTVGRLAKRTPIIVKARRRIANRRRAKKESAALNSRES